MLWTNGAIYDVIMPNRYKKSSGRVTRFSVTERFVDDFPRIIAPKEELPKHEACISDLLSIWKLPGRLDNLLYLSLAGEQSVQDLVGDLELMLRELMEYVRTEIYLPERAIHKRPSVVLHQIKDTSLALHDKLSILRNGDEFNRRIGGLPRTTLIPS